MALPADYHMHTPLCRHAVGRPVELAAQAVRLGLPEIGFSDHSPMPRDDFDDWRMLAGELDQYVAEVEQARREFPQLTIRLALEVDFLPGLEGWIRELASRHPWDYLIGSVHYVSEDWAIDNPHQLSRWKDRDPLEVWTKYFDRLTMAAESRLFDIIGHADLCKKFCFHPSEDCTPMFRRFLEAVRRNGGAIELNTSGLRKDCREIYPSPAIVRLAAETGVPITFGSDAHAPGEVAMNFAEAIQLARSAGYTHYRRFRQRQAEDTAIPD
jgi:histidinol-phosphatase (PHP family)